ncbi:MAG: ComEC/Rec2 family competence protein [Candidatus Beckwithbacteria bacterium]
MRRLIILLIWFTIFSYRFWLQSLATVELGHLAEEKVLIQGRISSEPLLQGTIQKFKVDQFDIVTKSYPKYEYGQKVIISGKLQRRLINKWYSKFSLMYPDIQIITSDSENSIGWQFKRKIFKFRQEIESRFDQNLPEPEASLLAGIVLGSKRGLPEKFYLSLQKTGTLHIVVASGFNVTVILGFMAAYLSGFLHRSLAIGFGVVAVAVYTVMAGAEPAIVRAAIMGSLGFLGQILGRKAASLRLLLITVLTMMLIKPLIVFDIGFQLSVAATSGLILLGLRLEAVFSKVWLIGKDLGQTLAAQIAVWPLIMLHFGQMSWFSPLVNGLILWLVPIIMGFGAILALTNSRLIGWLTYIPLTMMVRIIEGFGR